MIKIVFICLGNICRSPMAEFIMKDIVQKANLGHLFSISSAGTSGYHDGEDMHHKTKALLKSKNIKACDFCSQKLTQKICDENDYIFVMDDSNFKEVIKNFPQHKHKIQKITNYTPNLAYTKVPDPWYSGNFDETYLILSNACLNLFYKLQNDLK